MDATAARAAVASTVAAVATVVLTHQVSSTFFLLPPIILAPWLTLVATGFALREEFPRSNRHSQHPDPAAACGIWSVVSLRAGFSSRSGRFSANLGRPVNLCYIDPSPALILLFCAYFSVAGYQLRKHSKRPGGFRATHIISILVLGLSVASIHYFTLHLDRLQGAGNYVLLTV